MQYLCERSKRALLHIYCGYIVSVSNRSEKNTDVLHDVFSALDCVTLFCSLLNRDS